MISLSDLGVMCGVHPGEIKQWGGLVESGTGYTKTAIPQKRRRPRTVAMPSIGLDRVLKQMRVGLMRAAEYQLPPAVHGFVPGRDIVSNAAQHLGKDAVLRLDLSDFFGTIDGTRLIDSLAACGFDDDCATAVAAVTLVDGTLAQGFSTSPFLSNIAFERTDRAVAAAAAKFSVAYTRYVDDMTFSGGRDTVNDELRVRIENLLQEHGWRVNHSKTRFMRKGRPQYVTGLYVGDPVRPHIPRTMKRLLRREVYYAARFGVRDALENSPTPIHTDRLGGWVHYAAHADPVFGQRLREMWTQADDDRPRYHSTQDWDQVLDDIDFPERW